MMLPKLPKGVYHQSSIKMISSFDNGDVTKRELLFCGLIFGIMMFIGCLIGSAIKAAIEDRNLKYNQAVQISDQSQFEQAYNTDIGYAFVQGHFSCEGVSYEKIDGRYLEISVTHEEYRQHTRTETYTVTDGKGRTQTKTRIVHYWTWDTVGHFGSECETVTFKGKNFAYGKFNYNTVPTDTQIVSTGFRKRDVIHTKPCEFDCTVFCQMIQKSFYNEATIYYEMGLEKAHKCAIMRQTAHLIAFWVLWTGLSICICIAFVGMENDWLNKDE